VRKQTIATTSRPTLALVQIPLGEKDRAIEELEQAYEKGETNYLFVIRQIHCSDDLRGQPRFDVLVQKIPWLRKSGSTSRRIEAAQMSTR